METDTSNTASIQNKLQDLTLDTSKPFVTWKSHKNDTELEIWQLTKADFDEALDILVNAFVIFEPRFLFLKIGKEDFKPILKYWMEVSISHNLGTIVKDKATGKIACVLIYSDFYLDK